MACVNGLAARMPSNPKNKVKAPLPLKNQAPIMGLVSAKNYITANAVENILAQPKKGPEPAMNPLSMPGYAKVPKYLKTVKKKIETERAIVQEFHQRMEMVRFNLKPSKACRHHIVLSP